MKFNAWFHTEGGKTLATIEDDRPDAFAFAVAKQVESYASQGREFTVAVEVEKEGS